MTLLTFPVNHYFCNALLSPRFWLGFFFFDIFLKNCNASCLQNKKKSSFKRAFAQHMSVVLQASLNPDRLPEWHQRLIRYIRKSLPVETLASGKKHLNEMAMHTWKLISHAWLFIWKSVTKCPRWIAWSVYTTVSQMNCNWDHRDQLSDSKLPQLRARSSAHTLASYLLHFPHVFYFMPLLIQVFPAPISAVTKEAVENQWARSWETGASPVYPSTHWARACWV